MKKLSNRIADILILLGAFSLLGAVITKLFHIHVLYLVPRSYFMMADTCLLLAIAIYLRNMFYKDKP